MLDVGSASIYVSLTALTPRQDGGVSVVGSGVHRSGRTDSVRSPVDAFPGFLLSKTTEIYWKFPVKSAPKRNVALFWAVKLCPDWWCNVHQGASGASVV